MALLLSQPLFSAGAPGKTGVLGGDPVFRQVGELVGGLVGELYPKLTT